MLDCTQVQLTLQNAMFRHILWAPRESSQCVFDKCLTVDKWINLVNSSNVITKGKARLNRNSILNGRDSHQQTLTMRKVDGPVLAGRPAWRGGGGCRTFRRQDVS